MKPVKGLYIDTRPVEQPEGTYPFGKNGIQFDLIGSILNEPGFRKLAVVCPYKPMGVIETDKKPVIFSTNNTNSAVGFFDPVTETYTPIVDDKNWGIFLSDGVTPAFLGFKTNNYITGQAQRNYKGELVVAFTDKTLFPFYLNCDNPKIKSLDDLRLFAVFTTPVIDVEMQSGGNVPAGAYYVAIGYERNDGTSTQYSAVSGVTLVTSGQILGTADKVLSISVSNVDTNYDFMRIAIVSTINGVTTAVEVTDYQPITGLTAEFTYTGNELTTDIDVSVVLTPPAIYDQVGTIGSLNDYLYLGKLHMQPDINDMQVYANLIHLEWHSQLIDATNPPLDHINGKIKSFMHEEVYALYVRYRKTRGGMTKWYTIPNLIPNPNDSLFSGIANGYTGPGIPRYKIEDTIPYFDPTALKGGFGTWLNSTEVYPDTPDFDSTSIGGENLRNQPVRHHKTPSLRWCATNLYKSTTSYGQTHLDLLGISAVNVKIPDKYLGVIDGYEIGYAIRTVGNMTNFGQGALLYGATDHHSDSIQIVRGTNAPIYTSGGNFTTTVWHHADSSVDNSLEITELRSDTFRIHPFDILFNKPGIVPDFFSAQFRLYKGGLNTPSAYMEDGDISGNNTGPIEYLIDYTQGQVTAIMNQGVVQNAPLRHINQSFYCPTSVNVNNFINYRHEYAFCGYVDGGPWPFKTAGNANSVAGYDKATGNTHADKALQWEETFIVNLISVKQDIYQTFYSQQLTSAGNAIDLTDSTVLFGGDTFCSPYTYHTYGRINSIDQFGDGIKGIKIARRFVCESVSNINLRFVDVTNQYSDFWPKNPLVQSDVTNYLTLFDRSQEPNQFGYKKDFNALNNLIDSTIWNPFVEYIYDVPYRIHRGGRASRTGRPRSWRTFLAIDYYEIRKDMGFIIKLEGMDDRLIIHTQNAFFLTQDKTKLESGPISVTIGAGDIFQFEPQEVISSKLGYAGTQHDLACIRTPFGYIFVDALNGEIYIYKGQLKLLNNGINTFLRDFLKMPDVNNYIGNGITIGWDQRFKRILLTVKNRQLPDGTPIIPFQDTNDFWNSLVIGSIVLYQGRYIQYQGPNTTIYECPPDPITQVITWQPIDQFCVQLNGINIGVLAYANRIRLVNGTPDGYKEPNTASGVGTYFPPSNRPDICPVPAPVFTWIGQDGICLKNDVLTCPANFVLLAESNVCSQTQVQPATPPSGNGGTPGIVAKANSNQWNNGGARLFTTYNLDGSPIAPPTIITDAHFWVNGTTPFNLTTRNTVDSRMNAAGIWVQGGMPASPADWTPVNEFIGFSRKITVATARTVHVGMSADNTFKVVLNGVPVVDTTSNNGNISNAPNFAYWNIYPLALRAGDNYIEMYAENFGNVAGFAAEIYDNTNADIQAAFNITNLNVIFSTSTLVGQAFNLGQTIGFSCPDGWSLDTSVPNAFVCTKTIQVAPTVAAGSINDGKLAYNTRCRLTNGTLDGFCEPNTSDGTGVGPFVPPDLNSACIPVTPVAPGNVTLAGAVSLSCPDNNCSQLGRIQVTIVFTQPIKNKFRLLIGQIINFGNTTPYYVGGDTIVAVVGAIPGGVLPDPSYSANGANVPFGINIPSGVTTLNVIVSQVGDAGIGNGDWNCNNCNMPITDLYFQYDVTQQDPSDLNTYAMNLSVTNAGITPHNI